jgi:hypothetical protein
MSFVPARETIAFRHMYNLSEHSFSLKLDFLLFYSHNSNHHQQQMTTSNTTYIAKSHNIIWVKITKQGAPLQKQKMTNEDIRLRRMLSSVRAEAHTVNGIRATSPLTWASKSKRTNSKMGRRYAKLSKAEVFDVEEFDFLDAFTTSLYKQRKFSWPKCT